MKKNKIAFISDIHSNLSAFEAVLIDIEKNNIDEIYFLGDIVGYGPMPNECIELLQKVCKKENCIIGNHDYAFLNGAEGWASAIRARKVIEWSQRIVTQKNRSFIEQFVTHIVKENLLLVHGSPRDYTFEYLNYHSASNGNTFNDYEKEKVIFKEFGSICINGHTHQPGVYSEGRNNWFCPKEIKNIYHITQEKAIINIGSVGQPRDEDSRACYCIFDGATFIWRRVEYDILKTIKQINENDQIDDFMGQRLLVGR